MTFQRTPVMNRPAAAAPTNLPKVTTKRYVPPKMQSGNFVDKENKWITEEAMQFYNPLLMGSKDKVFAWLPMPMFSSQDPTQLCPTRYDGDESQFDEWAYGVSMVKKAGTDFKKQISFIPYGSSTAGSDDFISSPYVTLQSFITSMDKERKFAEDNPWFLLVHWGKNKEGYSTGSYLKPVQQFFLILGISLMGVDNAYNKDTKKKNNVQEIYYNPQTLGRGLGPDEKLTVYGVSKQTWIGCCQAMNGRGPTGDWFYPNPCDPNQLAVMYAWPHKGASCPVPGITSSATMDGLSGTVAGQLFDPQCRELARGFKLPPGYINPNGTLTEAYYQKVPKHIGDIVNYMTDEQQIKELAFAFSDARDIFKLAFARTDFESYLNTPEIESIFGSTQQKYVYSSSIYDGAPVSEPVTVPYQQEQPAPAPIQQPVYTQPQPQQQAYAPPQPTVMPATQPQYAQYGQPGHAQMQYPQHQQAPLPGSYPMPQQAQQTPQRHPAPFPQPTVHYEQVPPQSPFPSPQQALNAATQSQSSEEYHVDPTGYVCDAMGQRFCNPNTGAPMSEAEYLQIRDAADWDS